ncbi:MAG: ABC transporter permease, partial [Actinobacteria bacterium]|nr:ABC transporter permease [Actinomycetota bacterium]
MRRPLNLILLVAVPVIFVTLSAGALAEFAELVGASAGSAGVTSATASWAAGFLAGVAGFFHVRSSAGADRRLAAAGLGTGR